MTILRMGEKVATGPVSNAEKDKLGEECSTWSVRTLIRLIRLLVMLSGP